MGPRRAKNAASTAASIAIVAAALYFGRPVFSIVLLAGFIAAVTAPLVLWLRDKRVPSFLAVLAGLLVDALALGALGVVIGSAAAELATRKGFYIERFTDLLEGTRTWLVAHGVEVSGESLRGLADPKTLMDAFGMAFQSVVSVVSRTVLVLFVVAFMLIEATTLKRKILRVVTDNADLEALNEAGREVKGFLVVKLGTSLATGVVVGVWCHVLDVDLPLLWGLLAFLLNFIPTVGSILAAIPPTILALILHGPGIALAVMGGYLVVNMLIGSLLEPRLMGDALGLSPLVVFLSMLVWAFLLGPVGALLSGPLTMAVKTWLENTEDLGWVAVLLGPAPKAREADADTSAETGGAKQPRDGHASPPGEPVEAGE
ncbi:MAG TPA: AI-2E family transporter [Polyangiaceae bacterium LLY-WYZ-15_(1-7)]|nr:AI-2E family transporter [Polyangiaceae bacterium LLY-WYZ-15_(1-7)]HJL03994.1 AI-2E family transporter [Polyangiaceae bacterium LLY-WYZ-15_(1-7)]HJL13800.1 AI-2E family transporter [Polyangiaceae bacterium LLY-WYZ-15_(1-7)]HJL25061.1 AI-2E family transporter [Polyangiaceae bacterium LLY-WYZ-15_(1-7)]HJL36525.1 AI-2E family transporter [Polyangiaceae bacterium LLY-WYZ-15_(1-7)]